MIFKITSKDIRADNPHIDTFVGFKDVSDKVLKYSLYMYDYKSPFRDQPEKTRSKLVFALLNVKTDKARNMFIYRHGDEVQMVKKQLDILQFDEDFELYKAYRSQIMDWVELLNKKNKSDAEQRLVFQIAKDVTDFMENKNKLEVIIGERMKEYQSSVKKAEMTALEKYMNEKKL